MSEDRHQKTVRQHFVPRSYLQGFKDESGILWVYDKSVGKVFPSGEKAVAFENSFYDLEPGSLADNGAEDWNERELGEKVVTRFESEQLQVINFLSGEGRRLGIPKPWRHRCAFVMAIQYLRTSHYRKMIAQQSESFLNSLALEFVKQNFPGDEHLAPKGELTKAGLRHTHLGALLNHELWRTVGNSIEAHHWTLCLAPEGAAFNTSDNPVSRRPHLAKRGRRYCGFRSEGMEVFYPVSKACGLLARERKFHGLDPMSDGAVEVVSKCEVHRLNKIVAGNCERFVFGASSDFNVTHHFFKSNPLLRDQAWEQWETMVGKMRKVKNQETKETELKQRMEHFIKFVPVNWGG